MCFIDIFNSSYFALLYKSLLTITIAILITEMNCVFTDHDYFSCYKHDVSLCFLESRIIAVSANAFCEARRASHCHSPQTTYSSKSTCCAISAQNSAMHVVVYAGRLTSQRSIVEIINW